MRATIEAINEMQAGGVIGPYAIGDAVGATFYLEPSATLDIDIFVSIEKSPGSSLVSLSPIYDYLTRRGYKTDGEHIVVGGWPIQFLPPGNALVEEALAKPTATEIEGVPTRVMTAEHLVAIALQTARPKDHARILQFIEAGVLDTGKLDDILARHKLLEQWEQFGRRLLGGGK